jgi:epoxyqueuosine reductase
LAARIRAWGRELGLQAIGLTGLDTGPAEARLLEWLARNHHGGMDWMARHGTRRSRPAELVPGTRTVISARMGYLSAVAAPSARVLADPMLGHVSRYALGRDYHEVLRKRLRQLAGRIAEATGPFAHRIFVDSAPVLEKPLAEQAGLGWLGKHTNLLSRDAGSWFFLGEIYADLELPHDAPGADHCGRCTACIDACPTGAIVAPYRLDARRCIAYLTIELQGPIPLEMRPLMGNRVFGCDDCQLACPWNRFARPTPEADFLPRHGLDAPLLLELFAWTEEQFRERTAGSPLRRTGHERWLRNLAVALGNAPTRPGVVEALRRRQGHPSALVREHVLWALGRHETRRGE